MNIFCGSLPFKLQESELKEFFEEYGEVTAARIITDKFSGRSKGFGFVEMPDDEQAKKAIEELDGAEVDGRTIVVNEAQDKKESRDGRGYKGDNQRGGYNRSNDSRGQGRRSNY
ncbi:MAG: RNA recognition motif domain-containing protein [Bacteroidales bacterium]